MAGNILTPSEIFGDLVIGTVPETELISESRIGEIIISRVYLHGRKTIDGQVKVYGVIAHGIQLALMPALLVFADVKKGIDEDFIVELAKQGYYVLAIDFAGKREEGYYSIYPESISYANFSESDMDVIDVKTDVKHTCHYEWGVAGKYALAYVSNQPFVTKTAAIGIETGATVLWHVAATEKNLAATVFLKNAGWAAYRDRRKFDGRGEPQFSDGRLKYIAGVEPQSYAMYVKCPTLIVATTNDKDNDFDRVYDTASRISDRVYKAVSCSVGKSERISKKEYEGILRFLKGATIDETPLNKIFPKEPEIKCEEISGTLSAEVTCDDIGLKSVSLYYSEDVMDPAFRVYRQIRESKFEKPGRASFSINPESFTESVYLFAVAEYENSFSLATPMILKKLKPEINKIRKEKILFSGIRNETYENLTGVEKESISPIDFNDEDRISVVSGPMEIKGATSIYGVRTFSINSEKNKPNDDSVMMFDCSMEKDGEIFVEFISYEGEVPISYTSKFKVVGGKVWHNIIVEKNKIKAEFGKLLKSYEKVNEIKISGTERFIINNILWV